MRSAAATARAWSCCSGPTPKTNTTSTHSARSSTCSTPQCAEHRGTARDDRSSREVTAVAPPRTPVTVWPLWGGGGLLHKKGPRPRGGEGDGRGAVEQAQVLIGGSEGGL